MDWEEMWELYTSGIKFFVVVIAIVATCLGGLGGLAWIVTKMVFN